MATVDKAFFLADSSPYRFITLLVYTGKQATHTHNVTWRTDIKRIPYNKQNFS
jgi:hypothetical protein